MNNKNVFNEPEVKHGEVTITKFNKDGKEHNSKIDYMPKESNYTKGDVIKRLSKRQLKKLNKSKVKNKKNKPFNFYRTRDWLELRYRVLKNNFGKCMCCGRSPKKNSIILHVDHIKPRSKFPELELHYDNMQILCEECNKGKSNKDATDWRPI